tara:strand:- start:32074 stop:34893 length:2820 start_codon:yes stop_codon:yes gene_type:complete
MSKIEISGAKENNLQNISINIPKKKLVVITGVSGSGKSSLAHKTIYREGQRRYMDTFSVFARQFIDNYEKPEVDKISGLSPVISISQKSVSKNPRSTVGTITEIYDYLRLLFSKSSSAFSYVTGKEMKNFPPKELIEKIKKKHKKKQVLILSPLVRGRKGNYKQFFIDLMKKGFMKVRVNGELKSILDKSYLSINSLELERNKHHDIDLLIDDLIINNKNTERINNSCELALKEGDGTIIIVEKDNNKLFFYSTKLMCPESGISYPDPEPNSFSFNSPKGYCSKCRGLGKSYLVKEEKIIPDKNLSILNGAIEPLENIDDKWIFDELKIILNKYNFNLDTPIKDLSKECVNSILYGIKENFKIQNKEIGITKYHELDFPGVSNFILNEFENSESNKIKRWAKKYIDEANCKSCKGKRLKKESLYFLIDKKNITDVSNLEIEKLYTWVKSINQKNKITIEIIKELSKRIKILKDLGLNYLTINRQSKTLSGGESQRIRLATQIGSELVGVIYILDEPSIGLHQKDNDLLIQSLKKLKEIGNTVIVVEHDRELIESADYIIDIGPFAGKNGGKIIFKGTNNQIKNSNHLTSQYLSNRNLIEIPKKRRLGNGHFINLYGASQNNLKNVNLKIPLGTLTVVTGVSGSGKSTLINKTLYPILNNQIHKSNLDFGIYKDIEGIENIDKVISINQSPIGRTPRSNPATYIGLFSLIRELFSNVPSSKIMGYRPGRFSFNISGGRCENCKGSGKELIQMKFLPDFYIDCKSCSSKRFNSETLKVRYKGKNIYEVLEMTVEEAIIFFDKFPKIKKKLKTLMNVGMNYVKLGQPSTELSGGEAQRIKLALELSKNDTGKTLYIFDEPTTGLHFHDINILMKSIHRLIDKGNSSIIIEHNMDVIKQADHIIDLGLNGGKDGGYILCEGNPEVIVKNKNSYTAKYLKKEIY